MKKLLLILSIVLGLTYTANANAVYECSLLDEGQPYAQMIKYENKFVEIFPTGEVEEFFCTSLPFNYTERPVCISRKDGIQENDYIYTVVTLLGQPRTLTGRLLLIEAAGNDFMEIQTIARLDCSCCGTASGTAD